MVFDGVFSILPTPFATDESIDRAGLRRVIDAFVAAGVTGVTALGVASETSRLSDAERLDVLETTTAHVAGRVRVVAGAAAEGTRVAVEYARQAKALGADAVMVSPPRMPKLNSDAVLRHYAAIASAVDLPVVVQDFPPVSGYTVEPWLLARIAREVPGARTIKLEDSPSPLKAARIVEQGAGIEGLIVLGGLGGVFLIEELLAGTRGVMTGFAYPEILVHVVSGFLAGRVDEATETFYRAVPLVRFEFQEGIGMAIRKEFLRRRGLIATSIVRAPGANLDASTQVAIERMLRWAGIHLAEWIDGGRARGAAPTGEPT